MPLRKLIVAITLIGMAVTAHANDADREARQAELDRACEAARNEKLVPMRKKKVEDCLANKEFESREECEAFYADYGERAGSGQPLLYDLPACVEAFEYAQSERSGG